MQCWTLVEKLSREYQALRQRYDDSQRDLNEANNAIQRHLATINRLDRENTIYQLRVAEEVDTSAPEAP